MLMGAEVRTLALFVKYKLAEAERRKKSLGWELSCEFKTKEPADAQPHHIGNGIYIFRRGDVIYEYGCEEVQVQLRNVPQCYRDFLIMEKKGRSFYLPRIECSFVSRRRRCVSPTSPRW